MFPALAVCALVSALLIGPFFSELGTRGYLSSWFGPKYIAKVVLLFDVTQIPTVQFYSNDIRRLGFIVNGSLWTIASEVYCYLILFLLASFGLISFPLSLVGLIITSAMFGISLTWQFLGSQVALNLLYTLPSFFAGVTMYFIHTRFGLSRNIALLSLVGLALVAPTGQLIILFPLLAAYPVTYLGLSNTIRLGKRDQVRRPFLRHISLRLARRADCPQYVGNISIGVGPFSDLISSCGELRLAVLASR